MSSFNLQDVMFLHSKDPTLGGFYAIVANHQTRTSESIRLERLNQIAPEVKWEYHLGSFVLTVGSTEYKVKSYSINGYDDGIIELMFELEK